MRDAVTPTRTLARVPGSDAGQASVSGLRAAVRAGGESAGRRVVVRVPVVLEAVSVNPVRTKADMYARLAAGEFGNTIAPDTPGALALLAAGCGYCWGLAIRDRSPEGVMALSVMYDGLVLMAYYAMPMLLLGVRPTWYTVAGLMLVVGGMLLVRFGEQ